MESAATAAAESSRGRAFVRLILLAGWLILCVPPHLAMRAVGHSDWPRRFLAGVAWICGADVRCDWPRPRGGTLLLANHVSWLDIPVLAGATGCAFVSKAEIEGHWFMKWIADQNGTLYVDRSERRSIHRQAEAMRAALARRRPLAIFPEGTVGDGHKMLPFKPALLSAVAPPPDGVTVRPVAIDYGARADELAWIRGEHGVANFLRVLGRKGRTAVTVRLLAALPAIADRKQLASAAQDSIAGALAASGIAPSGL